MGDWENRTYEELIVSCNVLKVIPPCMNKDFEQLASFQLAYTLFILVAGGGLFAYDRIFVEKNAPIRNTDISRLFILLYGFARFLSAVLYLAEAKTGNFPSFLFPLGYVGLVSAYIIIIFSWIEIYHNTKDGKQSQGVVRRYRTACIISIIAVLFLSTPFDFIHKCLCTSETITNAAGTINNVILAVYILALWTFALIYVYRIISIMKKMGRKFQERMLVMTIFIIIASIVGLTLVIMIALPLALGRDSKWFYVHKALEFCLVCLLLVTTTSDKMRRRLKNSTRGSSDSKANIHSDSTRMKSVTNETGEVD